MLEKSNTRKFLVVLVMIITIAMIILLVVMATFSIPVADQLAFINDTNSFGVFGNIFNMYTSWSGRLIQIVCLGASYSLFGANLAQNIIPILLLLLFGFVLAWGTYLIVKPSKENIPICILIGFLLAGAILYTTYCLFDIYLWLDASLVYLLSMIAIVFDFDVFLFLIHQDKLTLWPTAFLLFISFMLQTSSEPSMLFILGWSTIIFIATLTNRNLRDKRKVVTLFFSVIFLGSLVMILSPGLWSRAQYAASTAETTTNWINVLFIYPLKAFVKLLNGVSFWQFSLIIIAIIFTGEFIAKKVSRKILRFSLIGGTLFALSLSYITFVAYFYVNKTVFTMESRVLSMANFGMFVGILTSGSALYGHIINKFSRKHSNMLSVAICLVCILGGVKGFVDFNSGYISVLSTRKTEYIKRDLQTKTNIANQDDIVVKDLPIMIERSDASDFTSNSWTTVGWFYNSFIEYYDIESVTVVGQPLYEGANNAEWYMENEYNNICVPNNSVVLEKYYCENQY